MGNIADRNCYLHYLPVKRLQVFGIAASLLPVQMKLESLTRRAHLFLRCLAGYLLLFLAAVMLQMLPVPLIF